MALTNRCGGGDDGTLPFVVVHEAPAVAEKPFLTVEVKDGRALDVPPVHFNTRGLLMDFTSASVEKNAISTEGSYLYSARRSLKFIGLPSGNSSRRVAGSTDVLPVERTKRLSCCLASASMVALGYPGDSLVRWFLSALAMVPFFFVVSKCPGAPGFQPRNMLSGLKHSRKHECVGKPPVDAEDWTLKGAVTPVNNREQCDSCWACSTTSCLDGDKQLVDCVVDSGCGGVLMNNSFTFAKKSAKRTVTSCIVEIVQESATGYVDVPSDSEQVLMPTVAQHLVPTALEREQSSFKSYSSGVLTALCESFGRCLVP